jgi:ATP-dependent Clp protease protease subunit
MNFFKKVVNKQTITDKGTLHHAGELSEGCRSLPGRRLSMPAITDTYTTAEGQQLAIKEGKVQKVSTRMKSQMKTTKAMIAGKFKSPKKPADVQNRLQEVKAACMHKTRC